MTSQQKGITFDLPPRYQFIKLLGSGGFGFVCSAFDKQVIVRHRYVGDGRKKAFKVSFKHITVEDAKFITALVGEEPWPFRLTPPPGDVWPLYVEFNQPPAKGVEIKLQTYEMVAIKRVVDVCYDVQHCKYSLREIKLLQFFNHPNIISLRDIFLPPKTQGTNKWNDLYIVNDLMDNNLRIIIKSDQVLLLEHVSYFMYQLFCGVKAMHDVGVIHRDLKPHNLLVNSDCELKICDFGMARTEARDFEMSDEVQTIWYRAPEVLVEAGTYSKPIDMWSCGTILGELLCRKALFQGRHTREMLDLIVRKLGSPKGDDLFFQETSNMTRQYVQRMNFPTIVWKERFPAASAEALDLLSHLLCFNPAKRFTIEEAFQHPFVAMYRDSNDGDQPQTSTADLAQELDSVMNQICDVCIAQRPDNEKFAMINSLIPKMVTLWPNAAKEFSALGWTDNGQWRGSLNEVSTLIHKWQRQISKMEDKSSLFAHPSALHPTFDDSFEAIFKDVQPAMEAEVINRGRDLIFNEIADFHDSHPNMGAHAIHRPRMTSPVSSNSGGSAASGGARHRGAQDLPSLQPIQGQPQVTLIELTQFPYTPVTAVTPVTDRKSHFADDSDEEGAGGQPMEQ